MARGRSNILESSSFVLSYQVQKGCEHIRVLSAMQIVCLSMVVSFCSILLGIDTNRKRFLRAREDEIHVVCFYTKKKRVSIDTLQLVVSFQMRTQNIHIAHSTYSTESNRYMIQFSNYSNAINQAYREREACSFWDYVLQNVVDRLYA